MDVIIEWVKEKCFSIDMVATSKSITISDVVMKNHTFFLWNAQNSIRKWLTLARDDEVVLRPFVQDNTPKSLLHSKCFGNVYVKVKRHVRRITSRDVFSNEKKEKEK